MKCIFNQGQMVLINIIQEQTKHSLLYNKKLFVRIRDTINELDSYLSFPMIMKTIHTILMIMFSIYYLANIEKFVNELNDISYIMRFTLFCILFELIISCLICGSVEEKSEKIFRVLDDMNVNDMSDYEYKQWIIFKSISLKTRFGFTIGGIARLNKSTLISVCIQYQNIKYLLNN